MSLQLPFLCLQHPRTRQRREVMPHGDHTQTWAPSDAAGSRHSFLDLLDVPSALALLAELDIQQLSPQKQNPHPHLSNVKYPLLFNIILEASTILHYHHPWFTPVLKGGTECYENGSLSKMT